MLTLLQRTAELFWKCSYLFWGNKAFSCHF